MKSTIVLKNKTEIKLNRVKVGGICKKDIDKCLTKPWTGVALIMYVMIDQATACLKALKYEIS